MRTFLIVVVVLAAAWAAREFRESQGEQFACGGSHLIKIDCEK